MAKDYLVSLIEKRKEELLERKASLNKIFYVKPVNPIKVVESDSSLLSTSKLDSYVDNIDLINMELSQLEKSLSRYKRTPDCKK